jgi:Family of unknown function (DUF6308)
MERADYSELGDAYRNRIADLFQWGEGDVRKNVAKYLNPSGAYAAHSFDEGGAVSPNEFTDSDFLAVGFLDTPIKALSYRQLKERRTELTALLSKVSAKVPLWEMSGATYEAANSLNSALRDIDGLGPTRVSKLMARKRPRLIPILDSRVREFFEGQTENFWMPLSIALEDEVLRKDIDALQSGDETAYKLSTLRLLDIAIWMTQRDAPGTVTGEEE